MPEESEMEGKLVNFCGKISFPLANYRPIYPQGRLPAELPCAPFFPQEFVMPEPIRHTENRGQIESLLRRIPGFRGYLEKEYRRESDELQREWLGDRLQRSKRGLDTCALQLADAAQIDTLPLVDRLRSRLDRLISRIRGAMQGYSGFFDLVHVDEALLDRVYEYDVSLMEDVALLADQIDALAGRTEQADQLVPPLLSEIQKIEEAWDRREDLLKGLE